MWNEPPELEAEEFRLDVEDPDRYLKETAATIVRERARTENTVTLILVIAAVASLPLYVVLLWLRADAKAEYMDVFERWITLIGPLAGAAVGVGARGQKGPRT